MIVQVGNNQVIVKREEHDPKFYGAVNAAGESIFLYHIKNLLNKYLNCNGSIHWIKKRMCRDNHLVDELQQYIRTAKPVRCVGGYIVLYNDHWAINGLDEDFNGGEAVLAMNIL